MKLVFVHGRAQEGRSSEAISTEWMSALNEGMRKAKLTALKVEPVAPYYGDKLVAWVDEARRALSSDSTQRGPSDEGYRNFLADVANEVSQRFPVNDDQLERHGFRVKLPTPVTKGKDGDKATRGAARSGDSSERGPQNWGWVIAIIRALDEMYPRLSSQGIELILRDVYLYCTDASLRDGIDEIVSASLSPGASIVIGHSLGSVVAYNVLQATNIEVGHFLTIGSPLAIKAIKQRLKVPPSRPTGVGNWYNARDRADIVALNPLTTSNFPTEPQVYNNDEIINLSENRHHISGYLGHPDIAKHIARILSAFGK